MSLIEILLAAMIFVMVAGAFGSLYVSGKQAFDLSTSQAYVQRQGTLIQEQITLWAKQSVGMQVVQCGANTTPGRSLAIEDANGGIRCIFQSPEAADTDANLLTCLIPTWTAGCDGGGNYNMLAVVASEVSARLGATLRVRNATFTPVTCVDPGGSCGSNFVGRSVTSPLVDVRFDLTDNTIPSPRPASYVGMRFGFGIHSRN